MVIQYVANTKEIDQVAKWIFDEWGYSRPDKTLNDVIEQFTPRLKSDQLPLTLVAAEKQELIGTASLVPCDMSSHPELTPWLSCLYIRSDKRRHGLGRILTDQVLHEARRLGYKKCYLWTDKWEDYYSKEGWHTILKETYRGEKAIVMEISL